jgi:hypothetical protein
LRRGLWAELLRRATVSGGYTLVEKRVSSIPSMVRTALPLLLASVSGGVAACTTTQDSTELGTPGRAHVSYAAGWKYKDSGWSPGQDEAVLGFVDADLRLEALPAWLVGKLLVGSADVPEAVTDPDADSAGTGELCVGLRKYASLGRAEPYASAGIALLTAGITGYRDETADAFSIDDGFSLGAWADAGIRWPITRSFTVGFVGHFSVGGEVELEGTDVQPGGASLLLTLGWRR